MKRKVIIFDMDGVLFNSNEVAKQHMKNLYPGLTDEEHNEILTGNFHEEIAKISLNRIVESEEETLARKLKYSQDKSKVPMYDGMKELLVELHNDGYILALNTSAYERNCLPLLENTDTKNLFDFLATAEISKSKVIKFKIIEEKYLCRKEDMLFITDTLGDIREADESSIPTVAVTWGVHNVSYFTREVHNNLKKIVNSIDELRSFIKNNN